MNNFNEYECLKNIYSKMIMLTAVSSIAITFFGPFILIYILLPNIFLYYKYYKNASNKESIFAQHIKNLLKKCIVSTSAGVASFIPMLLSVIIIDNIPLSQGNGMFIVLVSAFIAFIGIISSWAYYLHSIIKASNSFDKSIFNQ